MSARPPGTPDPASTPRPPLDGTEPRGRRPAAPTRSRARRWARRGAFASAVVALLGGVLLFWLLATAGGRDTLLGRIVGMLPSGSTTWERAEGVIRGPLVLHGVRYRHDGVEFTADRVLLDPDLLPVLGRRLQLDRLEVHGARLVLPDGADEPFTLPEWPGSLPRVSMPVDLRATVLEVRGLEVVRGDTPVIAISRADAAGVHMVHDGFRVDALKLDSDQGVLTLEGEYLPARDYASDLVATLSRPATDDVPALALQMTARGDLDDLAVELAGATPGRLSVSLGVKGDRAAPDWTLDATAEAIDPRLLGAAGDAWRGRLQGEGRGGTGTIEGELDAAGVEAVIAPSTLSLADGVLRADPLLVRLPQGPLRLVGTLRVEGDTPGFDVVIDSDGLTLQPASAEPGAEVVTAAGSVRARGTFAAWTLAGDATLERDGLQALLELAGRGDRETLRLDRLQARTPEGRLDGSGVVRWAPSPAFELDAQLAAFDPGYFLPDYPGAVDGTLAARGERGDDGRWRGRARIESLSGQLRGRALSGRVQADWDGDRGVADADVGIGASHVQVAGGFGERLDLQARFSPLQLADLFAGGTGRVEGTLALRGPAKTPDIDADLAGRDLRWNDHRAGTLRVSGRLPARAGDGAIELDAADVVLGGVALDRLAARGTGSQADLRLQVDAGGDDGELVLAGALAREGAQWRGRIDTLRLAPARGPRLALEQAVGFRIGAGAVQFDRGCLRAIEAGGRLCAASDGRRIDVDGEALPLALLQPWLPVDDRLPMQAWGVIDVDAALTRASNGRWQGQGTLRSAEGGLRVAEGLEHEVLGYRALDARFSLAGDVLDARLDAALAADGTIAATLRTGLAATAPMTGNLQLDVRDLTWLELFSEDIAAPQGHLTGTLTVGGTRAAPALSGDAKLAAFAAELPGLGLKLRDGAFDLVGTADGSVRVQGRVTSGDGVLALDGSLDFRDDSAPLVLALKGDDVTIASTAELFIIANPDLVLRWLPDRLEVRGALAVSEARVDLESLDSSVEVSPDVVVVDPHDAPGERARPLDLDFAIRLGDDVRLQGFGLDGRMTGAVSLRQRPGRRATASGTLDVAGTYRAYGQSLVIERARLGYANSPFDDPTLDIRAEREFGDVTVGVQVRGSARRPQTTIVSNPAMETSEALSWLVFGRPLNTTTGGESEQLGAAALALGAGGNLVAQQLGVRLGLDEAGVTDSRNLGGATFTIGKYVSPRLFLSYGISLIGTGQVVTLKYLLTRGFDISIESGNENAASLNWRTER